MSFRSFFILVVCGFLAFGYWKKYVNPTPGTPESRQRIKELSEKVQKLTAEHNALQEKGKPIRTEEEYRPFIKEATRVAKELISAEEDLQKLVEAESRAAR